MLPMSTYKGISFIDALFTSTSAVCVTGLIVLDTAKDFTFFGQLIILVLIQFGGLGIMTFSIAILSLVGGNLSIKWRFTFESFYSDIKKLPIKSILKRIVFYTFLLEAIAALILLTQFYKKFSFFDALWHSVFHAVSAFCNAGFSTFSENLVEYYNNSIIVLTVSFSIILGGIGFLVLTELARVRIKNTRLFFTQFSLHARFVLLATVMLIFLGTIVILLSEWNFALKTVDLKNKFLIAFFQSVTCRTAGFNTVDIAILRENTQFFMLFLMFVGGSPGSIAGGIKTTTMAVVILLLYNKFLGKKDIVLWGRALEEDMVDKSSLLFLLGLFFICIATFLLLTMDSYAHKNSFLAVIFEVTSAFGTVGLSMGITSSVSFTGKLILCLVMFVGRLGPLTLIMALTNTKKDINIQYPSEHIMIG
mgnify:FL=1